ncbi:MAG TPA: DUF554 domain-containing protein [Bdellovibrionota bacterium]|nr:DUF554 domain-containing protein [Bdellovibrionota bacterium]
MLGVFVNAAAIVFGTLLGIATRKILSESLLSAIRIGIGYATIALGLKMALKYESVVLLVSCLVAGGLIGAWLKIEANMEQLGERLKRIFGKRSDSQFPIGFAFASILFCTGAMAVVGSINSGALGDHEVLMAKSMLDGIFSITLGAIYGIGVAFSAITILLYQGTIALIAPKINALLQPSVINDLSGVGGVLVLMIGVNISGIKKIAVGDYFPAVILVLLVAPWITR